MLYGGVELLKIVLIVVLILIVLILAAGYIFAGFSMGIRRQTLEEAREWQAAHYDISWYDMLEKTDYTVASYDGYQLHVQFLRNPEKTEKYILISHGYTDNRFGSLKYTKMYLDLGFHVIIYDLRGHGENAETFCSYSARERKDLEILIKDSRDRYPDAQVFGIHGESLGAATSLACLENRPKVDFVVADCGFSEISDVLKNGVRSMHLPGWLVDVASVFAKLRYGYSYSDMRPIDCLKENTIPVLFLHGEKDSFIVPEHSEKMSRETGGYSEFYLIPDAGHAESVLKAPELYREHVSSFLKNIGIPGVEND